MPRTILIVDEPDDNPSNLEQLLVTLRQQGLQSYLVHSDSPADLASSFLSSFSAMFSPASEPNSARNETAFQLLLQLNIIQNEEIKKRNREFAALQSITSALNQSLELEKLLQICLERTVEALEADAGGMFLLGLGEDFALGTAYRVDERFVRLLDPLRRDSKILARVMVEGEVIVLDDLRENPLIDQVLLAELGYRVLALGPLRSKNTISGVCILARKAPYSFSEADQGLLLLMGGQMGMFLEIAGLYTRLNTTVSELRQTNAKLKEATRHKSEFLANMSHELRTPLNAIIGFSELLQDEAFGPLNEKQVRYVSNIVTSGNNLLALVNDVLDLAKVETGKLDLHLEEFGPEEIINEVLEKIQALAEKKEVGLAFRLSDSANATHSVLADRAKFKQILYNLLSNAVKFTPEGGLVQVQIRRAVPYIEFNVIDTGVGISPENISLIFEEFQTLEHGLTKRQPGTGLGLALSRRLAQLHQGTISVQSVVGQGSTFTLMLPLQNSRQLFREMPENFDDLRPKEAKRQSRTA